MDIYHVFMGLPVGQTTTFTLLIAAFRHSTQANTRHAYHTSGRLGRSFLLLTRKVFYRLFVSTSAAVDLSLTTLEHLVSGGSYRLRWVE